MPHKRRKLSDRQATRDWQGTDLAPRTPSFDIRKEAPSKGKMNILMAGQIRQAYHERRRKEQQEADRGKGKGKAGNRNKEDDPMELRIRPGERMGEFNARVEQAFAGTISAAARHASKHGQNQKKKKKRRAGDGDDEDEEDEEKAAARRDKRRANAIAAEEREKREKKELRAVRQQIEERDFATAGQRKSVRDVVDAPPVLSAGKFSKGAVSDRPGKRLAEQNAADEQQRLQRAEQRLIEQERERVIGEYRKRKESRLTARQS